MKLILLALACTVVAASWEDKYTEKYDSLDLDAVIQNRRLFMAYCKCVLDTGKCTPEAKELKSHITEALQNGCAKCTPAQRQGMRKVIKHLIVSEPETWHSMVEKYDPERIYVNKYEKELKKLH